MRGRWVVLVVATLACSSKSGERQRTAETGVTARPAPVGQTRAQPPAAASPASGAPAVVGPGRPRATYVVSKNALSKNALSKNALSKNALSKNALSKNALSKNALSKNALSKNALSKNALSKNALSKNALSKNGITQAEILALDANGDSKPDIYDALSNPDPAYADDLTDAEVAADRASPTHPLQLRDRLGTPVTEGALTRELMRYLVGCALPTGQSLDFSWEEDGTTQSVTWEGWHGLCSDWPTKTPTDLSTGDATHMSATEWASCRRWVSACLLARTNAFGVPVDISLRAQNDGPGGALATTAGERSDYSLREGTFYGDLWDETTTADFPFYTCAGPASDFPGITQRACSSWYESNVICPFSNLGWCTQSGQVDYYLPAAACDSVDATTGAVTGCRDTAWQGTPAGNAYAEAITVYVKPSQPVCGDGVCESPEDVGSCPRDCPGTTVISLDDTRAPFVSVVPAGGGVSNGPPVGLPSLVTTDKDGNLITAASSLAQSYDGDPGAANSEFRYVGDLVIQKYKPDGSPFWQKPQRVVGSTTGYAILAGLATDPSGNIVVAGYLGGLPGTGAATFGAGTATETALGNKTYLIYRGSTPFVARYSPSGALIKAWSPTPGGVRNLHLAVDNSAAPSTTSGDILLAAGLQESTASFGGDCNVSLTATAGADGSTDVDLLLVRLKPDGTCASAKNYGGAGGEVPSGIAADSKGNVLVTGVLTEPRNGSASCDVSLGGDPICVRAYDIFVAKYDSALVHTWSKSYGTAGFDGGVAVAVDGQDNVFLASYFTGSRALVGPLVGELGTVLSVYYADGLIAKMSPLGTPLWVKSFGSLYNDCPTALAVDADGHAHVTGLFERRITFDLGDHPIAQVGKTPEVFVVDLAPDGKVVSARSLGGARTDFDVTLQVNGIAVAKDGNAFVTGYAAGLFDLGDGSQRSSTTFQTYVVRLPSNKGELCNGVDDNGNAFTDEGFELGLPCGPCESGVTVCNAAHDGTTCTVTGTTCPDATATYGAPSSGPTAPSASLDSDGDGLFDNVDPDPTCAHCVRTGGPLVIEGTASAQTWTGTLIVEGTGPARTVAGVLTID